MGTIPTTDNKAAEIFDTVLKDAETIGDAAAESAAITYLPFLGWPVIKQLFELVLHSLSGFFTKGAELYGNVLVYRFQTAAEKNAYLAKIDELTKAQVSGDQAAILAAQKAWADAASALIHSDGSSTPK